MKNPCKYRILIPVIIFLVSASFLYCESLVIINRTGAVIELVQAAPAGSDQWGGDLIPDQVILDSESVSLDLIGPSPWAFRMMDTEGVVYVLYDVMTANTGKLTVAPEHQARLAVFAGARREITITNKTGYTITSLRISSVNDGVWGADMFSGRFLRQGESDKVVFNATPGTLSFDIRFTLISGNQEIPYEKTNVIMTDGASLVLSVLPAE